MNGKRLKEIQGIAEKVRCRCALGKYGIIDLFGECDRMGFRLIRYPIGSDGVLGFSQERDGEKIIFSNSSARLAREIFTVAHEIGHLSLHIDEAHSMYIDQASDFDHGKVSEEGEANYFAACLLMPEHEVVHYISSELSGKPAADWTALDIAGMMTAFQVSFDMALHRLENLHRINAGVKERLQSEKNQNKVGNLLRITGGNGRLNIATEEKQIPGTFMEWVVDNYNHGVIPEKTLERALSYFDLSIEDISDELHLISSADEELDDLIGGMNE